MKQTILLSIIIFIHCTLWGQDLSTRINNTVKILSVTSKGLTIEVSVTDFDKDSVLIGEKEYYRTSVGHESLILEKGYPELPKIVRDISIPFASDIKGKIIDSKFKDFKLPIVPSKGSFSRKINPKDVPYTFADAYSKNEFFPSNIFEIGEPYILRDVRGNALTIYPFAYNPVTQILRVYSKILIEISFEGTNNKNVITHTSKGKNMYFESIFQNHFINYKDRENYRSFNIQFSPMMKANASNEEVEEIGRMLVITNDNYYNTMLPFAAHKNSIGLPTQVVKMSDIGTTSNAIKNYIQNNYNNDNSLTFVLLVGNHPQIPSIVPSMSMCKGSDPSYSLLAGNDNYPDIIVGRFSGATVADIETMVSRTITYENMTSDQNWFHKGVGIASDLDYNYDGQYDYLLSRDIRTQLLDYHYTSVDELYTGSQGGEDALGDPTATMLNSTINNGVSIINYTGHGDTECWHTVDFSIPNVNALTNDNKLPFIFSVACLVGNFTQGWDCPDEPLTVTTCFAESWLRAKNSNTGNPTGAIAFYGSSIAQDWYPPKTAQEEFNTLLTSNSYFSFGALCFNASIKMISSYFEGFNHFRYWNIFGDPSVTVIPHKPCSLSVTGSINSDKTYRACHIDVSNAVISNNVNVVFDATEETTINGTFELQTGSILEIK